VKRAVALVALLAALPLAACSAKPPPLELPVQKRETPQIDFHFDAIDGRPISREAFAGRFTVLVFLTTYDVASQAEARFAAALARHHVPRVNVAGLFLESPDNRPLVAAFAQSLNLPYPCALADADTIAGTGPFQGLHHVPGVLILDRDGREAFRHLGLLDESALDAALVELEHAVSPTR
jgi:hypothetical protein